MSLYVLRIIFLHGGGQMEGFQQRRTHHMHIFYRLYMLKPNYNEGFVNLHYKKIDISLPSVRLMHM